MSVYLSLSTAQAIAQATARGNRPGIIILSQIEAIERAD
jgi:hypothetical protein